MSLNFLKIAEVLEAAADHFDAIENEKLSSVRAERQAKVDLLANKYAEATGEEMPDAIRSKLANSDADVVALIESMATKQASAIDSLGGPSTRDNDTAPTSVKEAAEQADSRFLNFIIS